MLKIVTEIDDLKEFECKFFGFFFRNVFDETKDYVDNNWISDLSLSSIEECLGDAGAELVFGFQRKVSDDLQERLKS